MLKSEVQIVVRKPPAQVFAYLADISRHPEWAAHKLTLRQTSPGPIGLNTTFDSVGVQLRLPLKDKVRVSEYVPNERFAYDSYGDLGDYRHYFRLEPEGDGTRIRYGAIFLGGPLYKKLPAYPIWLLVPCGLRRDLRRIRERLEQPDESAVRPLGDGEQKGRACL